MLKITEFAKLANTTRRTLIFYDEHNLFKPDYLAENGYRYYNYEQLYQFSFIAGLRNLGLTIEEIKMIQNGNEAIEIEERFIELQQQVEKKISELIQIQTVLCQRLEETQNLESIAFNTPYIRVVSKQIFWCSNQSIDCKEEEIARNYANFYNELNPIVIIDNRKSGFLTDLCVNKYSDYMHASFRFLKETTLENRFYTMPIIENPAGKYLIIKVKNNLKDITSGLKMMHQYALVNDLILGEELWQLNTDEKIIKNGASAVGLLQYRIVDIINK